MAGLELGLSIHSTNEKSHNNGSYTFDYGLQFPTTITISMQQMNNKAFRPDLNSKRQQNFLITSD